MRSTIMYKQTDGPFDRASFYYRSCSSTNDMAQKKLLNAAEGTIFITDYQYKGRGQRGSNWRSSAGENLLFSIILYPTWLASDDLFALQVITSLAIYDVLVTHFPKEVSIKWPNDIYYLDKKLGGILIETNIGEAHKVKTAILGIGLNVNQLHFELPKATSLAIHKGATLDRSLLLADIIDTLSGYYSKLQSGMIDLLWEKYIDSLYRKKGFHIFAAMDRVLEGSIITVNRSGALVVAERSGGQYMFRPKEVVFI